VLRFAYTRLFKYHAYGVKNIDFSCDTHLGVATTCKINKVSSLQDLYGRYLITVGYATASPTVNNPELNSGHPCGIFWYPIAKTGGRLFFWLILFLIEKKRIFAPCFLKSKNQ